jgi:tetratricopeptide (TPR) repeat protein
LRQQSTLPQRQLIEATRERYAGVFGDRATNEKKYLSALRRLTANHGPASDDAALFIAEALLERYNGPDLWQPRYASQRHEIATLLRGVMQHRPAQPMAHHLAIHFHDFDPNRTAALYSAARLASLSVDPESEHLVHMSAHAYVRAGRYADALRASTRALRLSQRSRHPLYYTHDYFVGLGAAFMNNDFGKANEFVDAFCRGTSCATTRVLVAVRFARWDRVATLTARRNDVFSLLFSTRALVGMGQMPRALAAYARLRTAAPGLAREANTTTIALAVARGDRQRVLHLARTLQLETPGVMPEMLPLFPARELQGRALLAAGHRRDARSVLEDDLKIYPCAMRAAAALKAATTAPARRVAHPAQCRTPSRYSDGRVPSVNDL